MTAPRIPRPRLPRTVLVTALVGGAVAGSMLGVGLALANMVLLALAAATLVGAGVGVLSIMWGTPSGAFDDELLVELALPLAATGGAGALVAAGSLAAAWLVLRRRVPGAGAVVASAAGVLAAALLVLGTITTAAFVPALTLLGGPAAVPQAVGVAIALGLVGAPLGALATWWMTWLLRARRIAAAAADAAVAPA